MNCIKKILLLPAVFFFFGCSFFNNGDFLKKYFEGGKFVPDTAIRIFILPPGGADSNRGFNDELLRRLKSRINLDGRFAVVDDEKASDLVLAVAVSRYEEQNLTFDASGRALTRRISVVLHVNLNEYATGRAIVKGKETDSLIVFDAEKSIISDIHRALADRLSGNIISIILTGWAPENPYKERPVQ